MVLSEPLLIEVPDHVSTEVAALTEPLAVAYRTVARAELAPDDVPLVVGCGPIGLAVIAVLKMKGVGPIVASEFSPERRALALRLGADVVVDPRETSPFEALITAAATDDPARMAAPTAVLGQLRPGDLGGPRVTAQFLDAPTVDDRLAAHSIRTLLDTPVWQPRNSPYSGGITCAEPPSLATPVFRCMPHPGAPPSTMSSIYHRLSSPPIKWTPLPTKGCTIP
jgi:hypothetical protein